MVLACLSAVFVAPLTGCSSRDGNDLSEGDIVAMNNLNEVYTTAWLDNDQEAVMDIFTENAVLIPHHGADAVIGDEAIRGFFWPADKPSVTVTDFRLVPDEVSGNADLGLIRGRFSLSFLFEEGGKSEVYSNDGNYMMILRKRSDGSWRVSHYIWNDPTPEVQ